MWVECFDGSYRQLANYSVLLVVFEGGSGKWWITDGPNANRIAPGYTTQSDAQDALRTLMQHVGLISV